MLIIALVLAVIGLAALVTAVVTSNELIAWVCIGASVLGVVLLIVDALRERSRGAADNPADEASVAGGATAGAVEDYPDEPAEAEAEPAAEAESADEADEADDSAESDEGDAADEGDADEVESTAEEAAEERKS